MKSSWLNYYKQILEKVSFDRHLLAKEYQKAVRTLEEPEVHHLNQWLATTGLSSQVAHR